MLSRLALPCRLILALVAVAFFAAAFQLTFGARQQAPLPAARSVSMPPGGVALQISLGLTDAEPADWAGEIKLSAGELVRIARAQGTQASAEGTRWEARSVWLGQGQNRQMQPVVLFFQADAPADAKAEVTTKRGDFSFSIGEAEFGRRREFLQGAVTVERVPVTVQLTDTPTDDDFPACAAAPGGIAWCAFVAYRRGTSIITEEVNKGKFDSLITRGNGDQVRLVKFDGKEWSPPVSVTGAGLDVWRPAVAVDGKGNVWVVWSQNTGGDWELYARAYAEKTGWGSIERVTKSPGADINVVATTGRSGSVWIAWQGWDNGGFGIQAQRLGSAAPARRSLRFSPANEWSPSIAADSQGRVYIAFDTYRAGNYDAYLWVLNENAAASSRGETVPIAASPRFEARPSIAVDKQDRVWVAYEDADPNWAKDFGTRWEGKSGVPFYLDRNVIVRCLAGGKLLQTSAEVKSELINTMYPPSRRQRLSFPRLTVDGSGRPWLLYRRHPLRSGAGERWVSFARYYAGDAWSDEIPLPFSQNLLDVRPAVAPLKGNQVLAVYSHDGRTNNTQSAKDNNLYVAMLGLDAAAGQEPALVAVQAIGSGERVELVHPTESAEIAGMRAYRATAGGKTYQLLRGEFHRHTEISSHRDQDGPFEEIWRYSLDVARMDWLGPGDHDFGYGQEYTWWLIQKQVDIYHHPPVFVPMYTHERGVVYPSGHRNVIFTKRGIRALPRMGTPQQPDLLFGTEQAGAPDIKNLYAYLKFFDGICASHTSATNMGTDWRDNDPAVEPVVEIFQGHRQNYEEPNAPKAAKNAEDSIGGYQPAGYVWNAFAKGYKLGFQVSSDHVSTHISYAVLFAEKPTREAILDAFKKRHTYGANDNIILDVRCGEKMMGDEFALDSPPRLDITVVGTAPVTQVDIVRQIDTARPEYVYAVSPKQRDVKLSWTDSSARAGTQNMYYVRIMQADGKMAWASPMWIRYQP